MRPFDYYKPKEFEQAFKLLMLPDKRVYPLAGATDIIPKTRDEVWQPDVVVDIKTLPGLRDIGICDTKPSCGCMPDQCLSVGAATRMNEVARSDLVRSHWDILAQGAAAMGNEQIRNRATIGGNICTASPAADSAPALLVLQANALIKSSEGERCVPIAKFFTGPGATMLKRGEIVAGILVPKPSEGTVGHYEKLSRRKAGDLSIVSVAALAMPQDGAYRWHIALGSVAPTPIRAPEAEVILNAGYDAGSVERAAQAAYGCCRPISDIRASADYRSAMVVNVAKRAIQAVVAQIT